MLSLELLLTFDIRPTTMALKLDDIEKLAGIAILHTVLNYLLEQELKEIKLHLYLDKQDYKKCLI